MAQAKKPLILVVDDEAAIREFLTRLNASRGRKTLAAATVAEALSRFREEILDLAILDIRLPDGTGIDLLKRIREIDPTLPVIMFTGHGTIDMAVEAMRLGATDFIEKPLELGALDARIVRALEVGALRREVQRLRGKLGNLSEAGLLGRSRQIRTLVHRIRRVAEAPSTTVLVEGESGSGKELVARAVHLASSRRSRRFLAINCAALSESLLEAELFGYERGSFTGASASGKLGFFEAASGGTLLLDEIGEMSLGLQTKLLRVMQERKVRRVGGLDTTPVDVRVIATTNRNLELEVRRGTFRQDLFYRLNVMLIRTPPLRERVIDIPLLAQHFLDLCLEDIPRPIRGFSKAAMQLLKSYPWPGNVRELKNAIERAVINSPGPLIKVRHLGLHAQGAGMVSVAAPDARAGLTMVSGGPVGSGGLALAEGSVVTVSGGVEPPTAVARASAASAVGSGGQVAALDEASGHRLSLPELSIACAEKELIKVVLKETGWNRSRAASILGINRTTLYDKLKLYEIIPPPRPVRAKKAKRGR